MAFLLLFLRVHPEGSFDSSVKMVAFGHQHPKLDHFDLYPRRRASPTFSYRSPWVSNMRRAGFTVACSVPFSYFREVEGITIFSLQRKYLCSSLAIRFKERFLCFSLTLISLLRWHSAKAIDVNEWLKAPGDFLTQETEIQTLLFGKWLKKNY